MLSLPAPAKLNLFLHITGQRPDGYHDLETLFQLLDYGDHIEFKQCSSPDIRIQSSLKSLESENNLIVRAAKALQQETGYAQGADIYLNKRLPLGGGLGGGSSDAATTLLGLNKLWSLELSIDTLAAIGLNLGADIPVFIRGQSAFARGVGEDLNPLEIPEQWYLVVTPQVLVSTGKIFSHPELTRDTPAIKIPPLAVEGGQNDCQKVVEMIYPEVAEARLWLEQYAPAFMTGTGASLFSTFASEPEAQDVLRRVPKSWNSFVARGVNQSPAHNALNS